MNPIRYEALADSIKVEDITANSNSRIVLDRIKRNRADDDDSNYLWIQNYEYDDDDMCRLYIPEGAHDMGWLGYFIGKNNHLKELCFSVFVPTSGASVTEVLEPFFKGVNNNKSITRLGFGIMDLLDGKIFTMLGPLFENSQTLSHIKVNECTLGDDGWRLLASAIGSSKHKSLTSVTLDNDNISDSALVDIITALSMHPHIQEIDFEGNRLGINGCKALATLLRCSATELHHLDLDGNEINDEGIYALVPELKICSHLEHLDISNNSAISLRGWQHLASILEAPVSNNLTELRIMRNHLDDDDQVRTTFSFVKALMNNNTCEQLYGIRPPITAESEVGRALLGLLCDTSSVNSTYLSNHTLQYIKIDTVSLRLQRLKEVNRREDKKEVAVIKILLSHNDINMMPFFEWEFKVLPLMIDWYKRASSFTMPEDFEPNFGPRKLSSIYQFVRGMPLLYVEAQLRKQLEDIKASRAQIKEERAALDHRDRLAEEHMKSIMEKLGRNA